MRHLFLILIALLSGSALDALPTPVDILGPVKQVPPQCADPTYACQDLEHARQCSVVKSCINDVWATMSAPEDNEDICTLCKEMVKEARDQLLSNMTQEELKEVFEGSCKLLPVKLISDACIKLVDEFIPDLVEMLVSRMDPNMVCTVAGLCNMAHLPIQEHFQNLLKLAALNVNADKCDECTTIMTQVKVFVSQMSESDFQQTIIKLCEEKMIGPVCTTLIDAYASTIYQFILTSDPKTVCTQADVCPSINKIIKVPLVRNKNVGDDLVCQFCTNVLEHIKEMIIANTTVEEFRTALLNFCTHLGSFSQECTNLVDDYYDMIFDQIRKMDTKTVCTVIGLCQSGVKSEGISPLVRLSPAETMRKHPKTFRLTPSVPLKASDRSQPWVSLVPSKTMSKKELVKEADTETNDIFGSAAKSQLPMTRLGIPMITIDRNLDCPFCKAVAFFLQKDLKSDRNRDNVRQAIDDVCGKWVVEFPDECRSFLQQYSRSVEDHIVEHNDFDTLCTHIEACPLEKETTGVNVRVIAPTPAPGGEICDLCKKVFDEIENFVKNPDIQNSVKKFFEQGCQILPEKQKCIDAVDANVDKLLSYIENKLQGTVACPALHLCPAAGAVSVSSSVGNIECDLCKDLVQQLVNTLQDPQTKQVVKSAMERGCSILPQELSTQCRTFVDENIDGIIQILISSLDPDMVCASLNICPDSRKSLKPPPKNDIECDLCKEIVQKVEDQLKDQKTEEAIKEALEKVCSYLPTSMEAKCKTFVDTYTQMLITLFLQEMDPSEICAALNICPEPKKIVQPPENNDLECDLCKEVVQKVIDQLEDQKTEEEIKEALEKVCSYLPSSMQAKCKTLVDTYTDTIIALLMQEMNAEEICAALNMCPQQKQTKLPKGDAECDLCKEVVQMVENQLKDKRTEDEIRNALDKVCSYLPSSVATRCQNFVNTYAELLISILIQEMDPSLVCAAINVCPTQDFECESCQYLFHYIQEQLYNNESQDELKNFAKRLCDLLPQTYANNCDAFIDEYGASLLVLLGQELDPSVVCPKIGMCPAALRRVGIVIQKENISSLAIDECTICTTVVDYLDKLLEDDNVDKEITQVVEKVCNIVPASVKDKCSTVIETYGPYILQMIGQVADSKQVCQDIDLCSRPPGHVHLIGGNKCTFGPSYWCHSKAHAAACKAEAFCTQKVWKD